jgi:formylglycine-generating enzyme
MKINRNLDQKEGRFAGMQLVRGGRFLMGSERFYADEAPVRPARVGDFWMDEIPVTNAEFARFVAATGHVTFAEIAPDPRDYPGMDPALAQPGSIVFSPPAKPVPLNDSTAWWRFVLGADWRRPLGPEGPSAREDHPVVHLAISDAQAYANWAGKALPTEEEFEYAARGGLEGAEYAWGDELEPGGLPRAKTFQGEFPWRNDAPPGLERTSPVRSYPANAYGLFDLIGNVWEWTDDWYDSAKPAGAPRCCGEGMRGTPEGSVDPGSGTPRKVTKGGSHLCAPSYCQRYRPAARYPQPIDTTTSHLGFRCLVRC